MPSLTQQQIDSANQTDLAEFLSFRGVQLKRQSNQYLWEDKNVWIHGSEWYSHYEQTGGHAVRFVMKYFDNAGTVKAFLQVGVSCFLRRFMPFRIKETEKYPMHGRMFLNRR